jgi:hypothetical protein
VISEEAEWLGLGVCQSGESKHFRFQVGRSLWGNRSLQSLGGLGLSSWDLQEVCLPSRNVGGMYCDGLLLFELVGAQF